MFLQFSVDDKVQGLGSVKSVSFHTWLRCNSAKHYVSKYGRLAPLLTFCISFGLQVAPGKGRVTKLSALPPAPVVEDNSTNGSANGEESGRTLADMSRRELAQERRSLLMRLFADTGTAKIPGVVRYVCPRLSKGKYFVATAASSLKPLSRAEYTVEPRGEGIPDGISKRLYCCCCCYHISSSL